MNVQHTKQYKHLHWLLITLSACKSDHYVPHVAIVVYDPQLSNAVPSSLPKAVKLWVWLATLHRSDCNRTPLLNRATQTGLSRQAVRMNGYCLTYVFWWNTFRRLSEEIIWYLIFHYSVQTDDILCSRLLWSPLQYEKKNIDQRFSIYSQSRWTFPKALRGIMSSSVLSTATKVKSSCIFCLFPCS